MSMVDAHQFVQFAVLVLNFVLWPHWGHKTKAIYLDIEIILTFNINIHLDIYLLEYFNI